MTSFQWTSVDGIVHQEHVAPDQQRVEVRESRRGVSPFRRLIARAQLIGKGAAAISDDIGRLTNLTSVKVGCSAAAARR